MPVLDALIEFFGSFLTWTAEQWQAVAAVGTLAVAIAAAIVALVQVRQSSALRREQSRPYVVAYMDRVAPSIVDLVIKNFGTTAARDIALSWDRLPVMHREKSQEPMNLAERLPLLVPGQEWRTVWDIRGRRIGTEEPHTLTLTYRDSRRRRLPAEPFNLDTGHFSHAMMWDRNGLHEIGTALEGINDKLSHWSEGFDGMRVWTRDGDSKDEREEQEWEAAQREQARVAAESATAPKKKPASRRATPKKPTS